MVILNKIMVMVESSISKYFFRNYPYIREVYCNKRSLKVNLLRETMCGSSCIFSKMQNLIYFINLLNTHHSIINTQNFVLLNLKG